MVTIVAIVLGVGNWLLGWPSVTVSGAKIKEENVVKLLNPGFASSLRVRIFGTIDGRAVITDPWDAKTTVGPGDFDLSISSDYYDDRATVKYEPSGVNSGFVTIQYYFH